MVLLLDGDRDPLGYVALGCNVRGFDVLTHVVMYAIDFVTVDVGPSMSAPSRREGRS